MADLVAVLEDTRRKLEAERQALVLTANESKSYKTPIADGDHAGKALGERIEEIDSELPQVVADGRRAAEDRKRIATAPLMVHGDDGLQVIAGGGGLKEGAITPLGQFKAMPDTPAGQFLGSAEWTEFLAKMAPGGREISDKVRIESPRIPIEGSPMQWLRHGAEVISGGSETSAGALTVAQRLPIVDAFYQRPITLLDLLTRGTTDSDIVEYVRRTSMTSGAASVPEATHIALADEAGGGVSHKPWAEFLLAKVTEAVNTIAVGTPATKRALQDAGQLRTLIDADLRYDLSLEVERQVVEGAGDASNEFEGLETVANTGTQAFDTSIVFTLRKAKTKVRTQGRGTASGAALNPEDIDTLYFEALTSTAPGMAAILTELAAGRIHGMPIVESEAITAGTAWVADWRRAFLWDRQQATIAATDGYMDFFMRNLVAILAELRAAFGVVRPQAFVKASFES